MAKLIAKIVAFAAIMLMVAKLVPYDGLIDYFTGLFDFQDAENITRFVLGEPDQDAWYSLHDYFAILINTLISIPLFSVIVTMCIIVTKRTVFAAHAKELGISIVRRLLKVFGFVFLFWAVFRLMPYEKLAGNSESSLVFIAIVIFNVAVTITAYVSTMKLIKKIRT